jgi:hypothetical protein
VVITAAGLPIVVHGAAPTDSRAPVTAASRGELASCRTRDWGTATGEEPNVKAHSTCTGGEVVNTGYWDLAQVYLEARSVGLHCNNGEKRLSSTSQFMGRGSSPSPTGHFSLQKY